MKNNISRKTIYWLSWQLLSLNLVLGFSFATFLKGNINMFKHFPPSLIIPDYLLAFMGISVSLVHSNLICMSVWAICFIILQLLAVHILFLSSIKCSTLYDIRYHLSDLLPPYTLGIRVLLLFVLFSVFFDICYICIVFGN